MKLRELLTAGAAAIAFASVASANELAGPAETVYAAELTAANMDPTTKAFTIVPTSGTYLNGNLIFEITLSGGAVIGAGGSITLTPTGAGGDPCFDNVSTALSSGGGPADVGATFLVQDAAGCSTVADTLEFTLNDLVVPNGADVNVTASVATEGVGTAVGGGADTVDYASFANAFVASLTADATSPIAQLPGFATLDNDDLGTLSVAIAAPAPLKADGATAVAAGDIPAIDVVIDGDFTGLDGVDYAGGGTNAPDATSGDVEFTIAAAGVIPGALFEAIEETGAGAGTAIQGGSYPVTASFDFGVAPAFAVTPLSATFEIERDGTDFTFAYTLDDTLVQSFPGTIVSYRISNNAGSATGPVTVQLRSWDNAPTTTAIVQLASSIPANGDLTFSPADIEALVGAYGVGDFVVNVEADGANLEASYTQVSNGGVTNLDVR